MTTSFRNEPLLELRRAPERERLLAALDRILPTFGFAGQRYLSASRTLVHERVAGVLTERLVGALDTLLVGQAKTFGIDVPPLIEASARERVERYVAAADTGVTVCRTAAEQVPHGQDEGCFVAPALAVGPPPDTAVVHDTVRHGVAV